MPIYKEALIISILSLIFLLSNAQSGTNQSTTSTTVVDYSGYYRWNDIVQIYECNYDSVSKKYLLTSPLSIASDLNSQFVVETVLKDSSDTADLDVIVKYLYYLKDEKKSGNSKVGNEISFLRYNFNGDLSDFDKLSPQQKVSRSFSKKQKYFLVKLSIFKVHATKVPNKATISGALGFGILNYPFKWRIQPHIQDFSGSFNVGAAISYTLPHDSLKNWSVSGVFGFGISSITLDKASVSNNSSNVDSINSIAALTFSFGAMLQYNKIQVGVFIGWDRISNLNNTSYGWKYQGNPWFSVGLGYSIFSTNSSTQSASADTQP